MGKENVMKEKLENLSDLSLIMIAIACEEQGEGGNKELLERVNKIIKERSNDGREKK